MAVCACCILASSTKLCELSKHQAIRKNPLGGEEDADAGCCIPIPACQRLGCGDAWAVAFGLSQYLRRIVLLPAMVTLVPALIFNKGGDAIGVCFNAGT